MTTMTRQDWEQRYQSLRIEGRAFIDGSYRDAVGGATFDSISPVDGRQLASVASCMAEDAELAVKAARAVFERGDWARLAPAQRKRVLIAFADKLLANAEELALLETPVSYTHLTLPTIYSV